MKSNANSEFNHSFCLSRITSFSFFWVFNHLKVTLCLYRYATNMKRLSGIMMDRPMSPVETGVYWTEFVLRHNSTSSMKPLNNLNFFQRRLLDALVFLSFVTALTIFITFLACKRYGAKGKIMTTVKAPIISSSSFMAKSRRKVKKL